MATVDNVRRPGTELQLRADRGEAREFLYLEPAYDAAPGEPPSGVIETWQLLKSRVWTIIGLTILGAVVGALITFLQQPVYEAHSSLEVQVPTENALGFAGPIGTPAYSAEWYLQTQTRILESRSLRQRVIARLDREVPSWTVVQPPNPVAALLKIIGVVKAKPAESSKPGIPYFELKAKAWENTQVVEMTCDSPNPEFSARYLNTLAEEYIQTHLEARWQAGQRTTEWLTNQLADLKKRLETSEQQLQAYNASAGLLLTEGQNNVQSDKLRQVQEELSKAQGDRAVKQSIYEVAQASAADAIPQVIDNERLNGYQVRLTELRRQLAELTSLYTPQHYKVLQTKAQIAELESTLKREREAILARIYNDYQASLRREKLLAAAYQAQARIVSDNAAKAVQYDILRREVDTNRQVYGALLQRIKEASIASAISASNVRVLDPAEKPSRPAKPKMASNILKGLGGGLILAILFVIAGDRINRSLKAPGEAPFHLKLPELGVIPSHDILTSRQGSGERAGRLLLTSKSDEPSKIETVTWDDSFSLLAESFRNVLASILLNKGSNARPHALVVTSSDRDAGKSTTVANLGIALAEIDQRVLIIDADLRKPRLHEVFSITNSWGLTDLLKEHTLLKESPLEALARPTKVPHLYLLPSGPGALSISSLLYSERMSELLQRFRRDFDTILIDTPPMLYIPDARILGRLADGAILVIRAGYTTRDAALAAKDRLIQDGIPLYGTILNRWDLKSKTRYGNHGYYYNNS